MSDVYIEVYLKPGCTSESPGVEAKLQMPKPHLQISDPSGLRGDPVAKTPQVILTWGHLWELPVSPKDMSNL